MIDSLNCESSSYDTLGKFWVHSRGLSCSVSPAPQATLTLHSSSPNVTWELEPRPWTTLSQKWIFQQGFQLSKSVQDVNGSKNVLRLNMQWRSIPNGNTKKLAVIVRGTQTKQKLVISHSCLAGDGKEIKKDLKHTCTLLFCSLTLRPPSMHIGLLNGCALCTTCDVID